MIISKAPGTCGEYLQGIYKEQPALISSPIDLYSETRISKGEGRRSWRDKSEEAYKLFLNEFAIDKERGKEIDITMTSSLPLEKGMASSTADIISLLYGLDAYFKTEMTEEQASKIAIAVEPSDNLMYKDLNLYNHYTGEVLEELGGHLEAPVLIINFKEQVNTVDFGYQTEFKKSEELSQKALELFKKGLEENDLRLIGEATTLSAENNQTALKHPYFKVLKEIIDESNGLGLLIGHSGSVIGILYDDHFDKEKFYRLLREQISEEVIESIMEQNLIQGGASVEFISE